MVVLMSKVLTGMNINPHASTSGVEKSNSNEVKLINHMA